MRHKVIWKKFWTKIRHVLGATLKHVFDMAPWQMEFVHPCFLGTVMLLTDSIKGRIAWLYIAKPPLQVHRPESIEQRN